MFRIMSGDLDLQERDDVAYLDVESKQQILNLITDYLQTNRVMDNGQPIEEQIKELCIKKLCESIGIKCVYNARNIFFNFFASIAGEAVVIKLHINIKVDKNNLKCFKFNDINLIYYAMFLLDSEYVSEAIIDIYELADRFKWVIEELV